MKIQYILLFVACLFIAPSQAFSKGTNKNLIQVAKEAGNLSIFLKAVQVAGLSKALMSKGSFTVFAPSNKAFRALPPQLLKAALKNPAKLAMILKYHVLAAKVTSQELLKVNKARTLQGDSLTVGLSVNGKRVIRANLVASNGVIHVIDGVMLPQAKPLSKREKAMNLVRLAINRGVPLFNRGQRSACSAIYELAAQSLLDSYSRLLSKDTKQALKNALLRARNMKSAYSQAWTLRYALDKVLQQMQRQKTASRR